MLVSNLWWHRNTGMITFLLHAPTDAPQFLSLVSGGPEEHLRNEQDCDVGTSGHRGKGHYVQPLLCFTNLPSHWTPTPGSPHPQPPHRATSPNICSRRWAPRDARLGKQMQKKPVGSSNVGLKIEWMIHPCLPCKIHPKLSLCLCFLPPHTPSKTLGLMV